MKVGWADLQGGDYENTGVMLYDTATDNWALEHVTGVVRIYPWRPGERMC